MEMESIVSEICDQADDFLAGVTKREEARAGIAEWLTIHHGHLAPAEKQKVIVGAMIVLERENFFDLDPGHDSESGEG